MNSVSSPAPAGAPPERERGARIFVQILGECRRRPALAGVELLWRLCYGIPLAALLVWRGWRIWQHVGAQVQATGVLQWSLTNPMQSGLQAAEAWEILRPDVVHTAAWVLPLALVTWAVAAGIGRNAVARRWDGQLPWRLSKTMVLQLLRALAACGMVALWYAGIEWAASVSVAVITPTANSSGEPDLALYGLLVVLLTAGILAVWAVLGWMVSVAPLLAVLEGRGVVGSLVRSVRLGRLTGRLVEVNAALLVAKLALVVLVTAASAIPAVVGVRGAALYTWWALLTLGYAAVAAFLQTARVAAYIELWRAAAAR